MKVLHVGCGGDPLPPWLAWGEEVRLDISPDNSPDVLASMTDMGDIGKFDAVYSSHSLEHLAWHDVETAMGEFMRVLSPGGVAIILVPDLEGVKPTEDVLYESPAGPITGLDMLFGFRKMLPTHPHMAHRSGFVRATLQSTLERAGFSRVTTKRLQDYSLMAAGVRP